MAWARIRQKMLDIKREAEGAANWNNLAYDPNPPLFEDEVVSVESEIGCPFPEEYRAFLLWATEV